MTANRYQVVAQLAKGGMGEILLARRLGPAGFEKLVVLKRPLEVSSQAQVAALIEEARLLARINHPNVCQVYDLEEADGQFFFSMEYLDGLSLWAVLADAESLGLALDPRSVCGLVEQVCEGLAAIHGLGAIHRDISPGNLYVTTSGLVKILDLGIAKTIESEELTPFGHVKGKMAYLSPEQVSGKTIDARADLFALGLVLYDLLRGKRPVPNRIGALAADQLDLAGLPAPVAGVVRRAVELAPAARFASAEQMAIALRDAAAALGGTRARTELAAWLAAQFEPQLSKQHAGVKRAVTGAGDPATATQILDLHPVTAADDPSPLLSRETERLELPSREVRSARELATEAHQRAPARRWPIFVVVSVLLATTIVIAAGMSTHDDGVPQPVASPTAPVASAAPSAPPPEPAPAPPVAAEQTPAPAPPAPPAHHKPSSHPQPAAHRQPPHADAAPGQLTIDSHPYAVIQLDQHAFGTTPIWRTAVPAGRYHLHASTADGRARDLTVDIEAGRENKVNLDWSHP